MPSYSGTYVEEACIHCRPAELTGVAAADRIPAVAEGVQKEAGVLKGNIAELPKTLGRGEVSLAEVLPCTWES